ncbi:DUF551 domain-containing protein [Klebsiella oxytoca]|uniref:DUF551 domain-containing protein n=1 Tax=Klebsiella oxytoca TaxID=571 RepID=UPI003982C613
MTSKLTIEQARRLRNDFECWQQDYDPKDDKEQYDMFGRGMAAMDMLIAGMYQEPVAWRVSFTQIGHESNNFTKTYWDEEEKDRWVKLHKMSGFKVNVEPLYTAPPVLAALDSEPVMFCSEETLAAARDGEHLLRTLSSPSGECVILLYLHAQPPVVLDDLSIFEAAIEECKTCDSIDEHAWNHGVLAVIAKYESCRAAMLQAGYAVRDLSTPVDPQVAEYEQNVLQAGNSPVIPDGYVMVPKEMTDEIGEAIAMQANCCGGIALDIYDAMLAAAPHDTPALNSLQSVDSVADTWIPVSERMPEGSEEVLCAKEFDGPGDWRKKVGYLLAGKWTVYGASWAPTHWMPLPNSPQEAK